MKNNYLKKIFFDIILITVFLFLMWALKIWFDWFLLFLFIGSFCGLLILKEYYYNTILLISFLLSLIWNIIAKNHYGYNFKFLTLFGMNFVPLFGWAFGLFTVYILYHHLKIYFKIEKAYQKFLFFTFLYWITLIIVETLAFHFAGIKDVANSAYKGLPICNCIHAPLWMKLAYFSIGLIYFVVVSRVNKLFFIENIKIYRKRVIINNKTEK